ncbi:hypothetical protein TFLX_05781 [Thermoflexales bacterium]|nr:hypothetical protein TFLX_05781 [Thermoflexales bacterium]
MPASAQTSRSGVLPVIDLSKSKAVVVIGKQVCGDKLTSSVVVCRPLTTIRWKLAV